MNKEQDKENQKDFLMFNKIKQLKKEIKKYSICPYCKLELTKLNSQQLQCRNEKCKKYNKIYYYDWETIEIIKAELKGYQEAREEFERLIDKIKIKEIKGVDDTCKKIILEQLKKELK